MIETIVLSAIFGILGGLLTSLATYLMQGEK